MSASRQSAGDGAVSSSTVQTGNLSAPLSAGASSPFAVDPLPMRDGSLGIGRLIDLYMAHYAGRDPSRIHRLNWWTARLAGLTLSDVSDDDIHAALESLAEKSATFYAGLDASGKPIYRAKRKPVSPATVNRYNASIGAVFTWAIKRRIAPKGWIHPCRSVERRPENNEKTRFLSDEERSRLLEMCRSAHWPKLYLLVLLALTTGARKGELMGLRWADIDFAHAVAYVGRSKNGDPKTLPLVPAVVEELRAHSGAPSSLAFCSSRSPTKPFSFESVWKATLKRAKIKNFRFHDLRHSCASMLAQNGATLLEIGDLLGHRQLQVTKRYSHLATGHKAALVNRVLGNIR